MLGCSAKRQQVVVATWRLGRTGSNIKLNLNRTANWFKLQVQVISRVFLVFKNCIKNWTDPQHLYQWSWHTQLIYLLLIVWVAVWTHTFRKLKFHCYLHSFLSFTLLPTLEVSLRLSTSVNIIIISPLQSIRIRYGMIRFGSVRFGCAKTRFTPRS